MMSGKAPAGPELWRHCIESSVLAGAGILLLAVLLPPAVHVLLLILAGAILSACMMYAALATAGSVAIGAWLLAWGVTATSWMAAARIVGPWHEIVIAGLILPVLVLAMTGPVAIGHHRAALEKEEKAREARANEKALRRWQNLLAGCGVDGTEILDETELPGGRDVHGRFGKVTGEGPRPGTIRDLQGAVDLIAQHRRVPPSAITVDELPRAEFMLHIREETGPREIVYLPAENNLLTINRELGLAVKPNGREWGLKIREANVLIAGVTGSGKSNLMSVMIAQLARCVDVVIFMIDLKGGRAVRPWMTPWIQKFTPRPVIDWIATTREEANLMLEALWAAREDRSRSGAGGEKITPSADRPAILLLCDEVAVLFGHGISEDGLSNAKMSRRGVQIAETGRSEAINIIAAAVRANVETNGSTGFKAMSRIRIGTAVSQESDAASLFPDDPHAVKTLGRITEPGTGIAKVFGAVSPVLQFYRITDGNPDPETGQPTKDRITPVALSTGNIRPQLDDRTMLAMGPAYAERWTRPHGQALLDEWRGQAGVKPPVDTDSAFGQIVAHIDDPEAPIDPRQARMREILIERRWQGATVNRLVTRLASEGLTTPRETVQRWLAKDEKAGMCRRGGKPHYLWKWVFAEDDLSGTG
jgi:hypothetical protein